MKPDTHSLDGLFASDVRYVVPLYQRPYVWRKRSHWEPLWEDVLHVLDRHLDKDASTRGLFLGAVVLEQEHTNPGEILDSHSDGHRGDAARHPAMLAARVERR